MPRSGIDASAFPSALSEVVQTLCKDLRAIETEDAFAVSAVLTMLAMGLHYWGTSRFLCAGAEHHIDGWIDERTLALPLIDRTLLESAANIVFILEKPQERGLLYFQGGWRDQRIELDKSIADFGSVENEDWKTYIKHGEAMLAAFAKRFHITEAELAKPSTVRSWPSFGAKVRCGDLDRMYRSTSCHPAVA